VELGNNPEAPDEDDGGCIVSIDRFVGLEEDDDEEDEDWGAAAAADDEGALFPVVVPEFERAHEG
jgi:hypothetical protein